MATSKQKYYRAVDGAELITEAQLKSAIKRINDRLYQMAKEGYNPMYERKGSASWKAYQNLANALGGIQWKEGKAGTSREGTMIPSISTKGLKAYAQPVLKVTKRDLKTGAPLETKLVNSETAKLILHYDVYGGTIAQEKKNAKRWLEESGIKNPTAKQIRNAVMTLANLEQFIQDHADSIYQLENMTGEDIVHNNDGHLTVEEVERIMNVENEIEDRQRIYINESRPAKYQESNNQNIQPLSWF